MKRIAVAAGLILLVLAVLATGYWWGARQSPVTPAKAVAVGAKAERKVLYYRNPMGLPDTSPVPKKAPDGMDYVAVYADEESGGGAMVRINSDKVQKLGVRTEDAAMRALVRTVRAVGTVQADERGLHTIAPKFDGWIQRLYVNTTGQAVAKGQALMDVYSPDLIATQQEYLIAVKGLESLRGAEARMQAGMQELMDSAMTRLRNWDISGEELERLRQEGKPRQFLTLRSQANGVVIEKPSIEGKRFMAGEALYQIADLSNVWVIAEVFERELDFVHPGQAVKITVDAYPTREFTGRVTFIYPTLTSETRTVKVRIELPNVERLLKPAMYARLEMASGHGGAAVLTVPDSAVLDTGTRQLVLVRRGEGAFEPRTVRTGLRADNYVEVLDGLIAGETVVVSANFLIDAESNLKAALGGMGGMAMGEAKPAAAPSPATPNAVTVEPRQAPAADGSSPAAKHPGH